MNFTARIKSARYKPNYILNVSIDIPLRPSQLMSDRPVSGEFTFSPSQLKKKLKLQVPSARTTKEAESRRLSCLGDTQQTIPALNNNKRKGSRSLIGSCVTSNGASKKNKLVYKSEATSPSRRKAGSKNSKLISSNKTIKNSKILNRFVSQSQDNIIRYTNQSSQMKKQREEQFSPLTKQKIMNLKSKDLQIPQFSQQFSIEDYQLLNDMRQFQKNAEQKKQYLNYMYLKEKVLVLASVKKIQRAWRNYKTKKLLRSYSNDISLKFTNKMRGFRSGNIEQPKSILSVRSCGIGQKNSLKKAGKKQISELNNEIQEKGKKITSQKQQSQCSISSAMIKFQMEEIKRWEQIIKQTRQGNNVEQILKQSFRRKQQLQKQIGENGMIGKQYNFFKNKGEKKRQKQISSPSVDSDDSRFQKNSIIANGKVYSSKQSIVDSISDTSFVDELAAQTPNRSIEQKEEDLGTTIRRRKKLQFFENQIRKIDNQGSQSNYSHNSFTLDQKFDSESSINSPKKSHVESQYEENQKLKKKLQLITKLSLLEEAESYADPSLSSSSQSLQQRKVNPRQKTHLPLKRQIQKLNEKKFPLPRNTTFHEQNEDRLDTYRQSTLDKEKKSELPQQKTIIADKQQQCIKKPYIPSCEQKLKNRKKDLEEEQKQTLVSKFLEELIYEVLLQFSDSDAIVSRIKQLYDSRKQVQVQQKPEGICTNLESIKDYLENFVAFLFEQHPKKIVQGLTTLKGYSEIQLFKKLRETISSSQHIYGNQDNNGVISMSEFDDHWNYASQQIYFDTKFPNDPQKQKKRVSYLKQITKIYFRAIFDGFNECLEPHRYYGRTGKPYIWCKNIKQKNQIKIKAVNEAKPKIRLAYKKLSQLAIVYCGLHLNDKKHSMPEQMVQEIQQQRMNTLLQIQIQDEEYRWEIRQQIRAQIMQQMSILAFENVIYEFCEDLSILNCL